MLNVNVGVLGHVDSGKTSLCKALSTQASTAAFDKNPQSKERGITLDLGFSAFYTKIDPEKRSDMFAKSGITDIQFTLVDCPGHASLIRTIMGGAQIIDIMILVIDIAKGIQTQTAECLVIGEMLGKRLLVVLNKVDLIRGENDAEKRGNVEKAKKKLRTIFQKTRWPNVNFVEVAAAPSSTSAAAPIGISELTDELTDLIEVETLKTAHDSASKQTFLMYVDHCFPVKGQGTVLTGTILDGTVSVGDEILLPDFGLTKKVKSMQMFKKSIQKASKGDRLGVCVTQFDAQELERGIVCGPHAPVVNIHTAVCLVNKVRFHKLPIEANTKYHVTVGHHTVMGTMKFFSKTLPENLANAAPIATTDITTFDVDQEYDFVEALPDESVQDYFFSPSEKKEEEGETAKEAAKNKKGSNGDASPPCPRRTHYYAVILLEKTVTTIIGSTIIASRLDTDIHANMCRLAIEGKLLCALDVGGGVGIKQDTASAATTTTSAPSASQQQQQQSVPLWRTLKVTRPKLKMIHIDRIVDESNCIGRNIVSIDASGNVLGGSGGGSTAQDNAAAVDVSKYVGLKVEYVFTSPPSNSSGNGDESKISAAAVASTPAVRASVPGVVESTFGKSSKIKIRFSAPLFPKDGKKGEIPPGRIVVSFKKFAFALHGKLVQESAKK